MGKAAACFSVLVALALCEAALSVPYGGPIQYARNFGADLSDLEMQVPVKAGLAWGYYAKSCPSAEKIVADSVAAAICRRNVGPGVSPGLLRLIFHDCFVQGCDASILLRLPSGTELDDPANASIRQIALDLVDDAKARIEKVCPGVVSCADILVLAGRESIKQVGGPAFNVPLGRRDSLSFSASTSDLPGPSSSFQQQVAAFTKKNLDATDLVALAGAHTVGVAQCGSFTSRLRPTVDPKLNKDYAKYLLSLCPADRTANTTGLDYFSPSKFDNRYYKAVLSGGALLASDQNLDQNAQALNLVRYYAVNQTAFFNQFSWSYLSMSQISPLTGKAGQIRKKCSTTNGGKTSSTQKPKIISMVTNLVEGM